MWESNQQKFCTFLIKEVALTDSKVNNLQTFIMKIRVDLTKQPFNILLECVSYNIFLTTKFKKIKILSYLFTFNSKNDGCNFYLSYKLSLKSHNETSNIRITNFNQII